MSSPLSLVDVYRHHVDSQAMLLNEGSTWALAVFVSSDKRTHDRGDQSRARCFRQGRLAFEAEAVRGRAWSNMRDCQGTLEEVRTSFQDSMKYCARDVLATQLIFQKVERR